MIRIRIESNLLRLDFDNQIRHLRFWKMERRHGTIGSLFNFKCPAIATCSRGHDSFHIVERDSLNTSAQAIELDPSWSIPNGKEAASGT